MTKPTPNPWYVEQDNDGRDLYIVAKAKDDIGQRIATIEISGFGSAKAGDWANARLIAAAPELLEACDLLERYAREVCKHKSARMTEDARAELLADAIIAAGTAVTKAKGKRT